MDSTRLLSCIAYVFFLFEMSSSEEAGRIITQHAIATQSSTYKSADLEWSAVKILDGCYSGENCIARTRSDRNNWIRIDLGNIYKILSVVICTVTKESCKYMAGLDNPKCRPSPTCSHIESLSDVHVEFSKLITGVVSACLTPDFSSDKAATNITIRSTEDGIRIPNSRFITLRSDNAPLAVAEIRVFGECPTSYCGPNCTEFCFCENPLLGQEQLQGTPCRGGCLTGWMGQRCNIRNCSDKTFGSDCWYACHCHDQCDPWTGECIGLDKRCSLGWYGRSCQKSNIQKEMQTRDIRFKDGNTNTCEQALTTEIFSFPQPRSVSHLTITLKKDVPANDGDFQALSILVSTNEMTVTCNAVEVQTVSCDAKTIKASYLCKGIYTNKISLTNITGRICEIELFVCSAGSFGPDCNNRCHCLESQCNSVDGTCIGEGKCRPGWYGRACDLRSPPPKTTSRTETRLYLSVSMTHKPTTDDITTNRKIMPSIQTKHTLPARAEFNHNPDFIQTCHCLHDYACDNTTGICLDGCSAGWTGWACSQACLFGTYGINCSLNCGHCAANQTCHTETGHCPSGCADGWTAETCQTYVSERPNTNWIAKASGIIGSLVAIAVLVVIIFILRRRIKRKAALPQLESSETAAVASEKVYTAISRDDKGDTEHEYEEIQAIVNDSSNTPVKQFPAVYKTLLSTWTDGKTVLFHAFQSLRATEREYYNIQQNRTNNSKTLDISYKDLVAKNECSSTSETCSTGESLTQILQMDRVYFIVSNDDASHDRFWKAAAVHNTTVCFHLGKASGPLSLSKGGHLNTENFAIVCSSLTRRKSAVHRKLSVKSLDTSSSIIMEVISYEIWEDMEDIPVDLMSLLDMIKDISLLQRKQRCLMIHNKQNIHKPIMLAIATAVLMKMEDTGLVDILGHIKAAWRAVATSMATYEQFRFLHDIVLLSVKKKCFINRR